MKEEYDFSYAERGRFYHANAEMNLPNSNVSRFVICINNTGFQTSLEVNKRYEVLYDSEAERNDQIRVIDESGEDYLYPKSFFKWPKQG